MALVLKDRVRDTTTTTGTGPFTLAATPPVSYQAFGAGGAALSVSDTFYGVIAHQSANEWVTGLMTYSAANQVTVTTVFESSNAGSAVTFSAGTKDVFIDLPATQVMFIAQPTVQTFTASGTWTKPARCRRVRVSAVGGGGGGGGAVAAASNAAAAVGGGSGAFGLGVYDVTGTSTVTVTIGAAGAAGASGASGGAGGQTSFGALLTAPGGTGGIFMTSGTALSVTGSGSSAAAGTGGSINSGGNAGEGGIRLSGTIAMSGNGAPGPWGGGTIGKNSASGGEGVGLAATGPGAGGSAALSLSATGFAGGAGAVGMVLVEEFY